MCSEEREAPPDKPGASNRPQDGTQNAEAHIGIFDLSDSDRPQTIRRPQRIVVKLPRPCQSSGGHRVRYWGKLAQLNTGRRSFYRASGADTKGIRTP